jgi:hypothetical protein
MACVFFASHSQRSMYDLYCVRCNISRSYAIVCVTILMCRLFYIQSRLLTVPIHDLRQKTMFLSNFNIGTT